MPSASREGSKVATERAAHKAEHHTSCRAAARKMVAGVKGVAFLDGDTMAVTSSTKGELFLVSKASQTVLRRVELDVKAGDRVLFGKWSGTEVKLNGEDLLIMKESDIMGIVG